MIGLIITINGYNKHFYSFTNTFLCENLEKSKEQLIKYLANEFNKLDIDFPKDIYEFENIWFDNQYVKTTIFDYKLFLDNKWEEPWEYENLYYDILDEIINIESNQSYNFEKLYGEPNEDESDNINNYEDNSNEYLEVSNDPKLKDFEDNISQILINSKNI
jgi:hypothetical protein